MKGKTLEQKISLVLYGAAIFFAFLFALGFILKADLLSKWPTASDFYEIGKDAFTITAYYLAPAAALILFSDWRQEHLEKSREQQGQEIYNLVKQIEAQLNEFHVEVLELETINENTSDNMEEIYKSSITKISKLDGSIIEFDFEDEIAKKFIDLIKEISATQRENCIYISQMYTEKTKMFGPDQYNTQFDEWANKEIIFEHKQRFEGLDKKTVRNFHEMFGLIKEVKPLKDSLKVRSVSPN